MYSVVRFSIKNNNLDTLLQYFEQKEDKIEISVQDSGPGIAEGDLNKIFKKFVQIKTNGQNNSGSLGIGLAISKEVVETHEGQIGVESELGKGARFYFTVPA